MIAYGGTFGGSKIRKQFIKNIFSRRPVISDQKTIYTEALLCLSPKKQISIQDKFDTGEDPGWPFYAHSTGGPTESSSTGAWLVRFMYLATLLHYSSMIFFCYECLHVCVQFG